MSEQIKKANEESIREAKGLGFVTALSTAGVPEDKISDMYSKYVELDTRREQTLRTTYDTLLGKDTD
jgi:hypothetical protein